MQWMHPPLYKTVQTTLTSFLVTGSEVECAACQQRSGVLLAFTCSPIVTEMSRGSVSAGVGGWSGRGSQAL
eukprot:4847579-Amphidinium_carterae.1